MPREGTVLLVESDEGERERLGKGESIDEIVGSMNMVAEGVKSCKPIFELGQEAGVYTPITENVVKICHEGAAVTDVVQDLLAREVLSEFAGVEEYLTFNPERAAT